MTKEKGINWWKLIFWGIVILIILNLNSKNSFEYRQENCDLEFSRYTFNSGCSVCDSKCGGEGFEEGGYGYFEPFLSGEQMNDQDLEKRCTCVCRGCR